MTGAAICCSKIGELLGASCCFFFCASKSRQRLMFFPGGQFTFPPFFPPFPPLPPFGRDAGRDGRTYGVVLRVVLTGVVRGVVVGLMVVVRLVVLGLLPKNPPPPKLPDPNTLEKLDPPEDPNMPPEEATLGGVFGGADLDGLEPPKSDPIWLMIPFDCVTISLAFSPAGAALPSK